MRKDGLVVLAEVPVRSTLNKGRIEVMEFTAARVVTATRTTIS